MSSASYYFEVAEGLRQRLAADDKEPREWSDADKLRVLAALFDDADIRHGKTGHEVQDDLRRMADLLERRPWMRRVRLRVYPR